MPFLTIRLEQFLKLFINLGKTAARIDDFYPPGVFPRSFQIGITHAPVIGTLLPFEPIRILSATRPPSAQVRTHVEQDREIRLQTLLRPPLENADLLPAHSAASCLVGISGIGKAVAQH